MRRNYFACKRFPEMSQFPIIHFVRHHFKPRHRLWAARWVTELASGTFQSTGRWPGNILTQMVRRLAPAALTKELVNALMTSDSGSLLK